MWWKIKLFLFLCYFFFLLVYDLKSPFLCKKNKIYYPVNDNTLSKRFCWEKEKTPTQTNDGKKRAILVFITTTAGSMHLELYFSLSFSHDNIILPSARLLIPIEKKVNPKTIKFERNKKTNKSSLKDNNSPLKKTRLTLYVYYLDNC